MCRFLPGNHEAYGVYARHLDEVMPCRPVEERGIENFDLKWNFAVRQGDIALIGLDTGNSFHDADKRFCGLEQNSAYRRRQTVWLEKALSRPEIAAAPFAVIICHIPLYNSGPNPNGCEKPLDRGGIAAAPFAVIICHIPLYNSGPNPNGCEKPLDRGGSSWVRECNEQWGPILDRYGVQLVICGHEHLHRWDENTGYNWKQVLGGGPELGYGAGFVPDKNYYPTIIEGVVENGKLVVRVHDAWRDRVVDVREFARR